MNRVGKKALNFQSVVRLSEYSELEYLDNLITRPEVAFFPAFLLGNNHVYTNRAGKQLFSSSLYFFISIMAKQPNSPKSYYF